jgi:hypothetical protein
VTLPQLNASLRKHLAHRPIPFRGSSTSIKSSLSGCSGSLENRGCSPPRVRLRQCKYLNNIIEQDHRIVKKRTWLAKGYGSFQSAWRTLEDIETMSMIRKGRVKWIAKGDVVPEASSSPSSSLSLPNFPSPYNSAALQLRALQTSQ